MKNKFLALVFVVGAIVSASACSRFVQENLAADHAKFLADEAAGKYDDIFKNFFEVPTSKAPNVALAKFVQPHFVQHNDSLSSMDAVEIKKIKDRIEFLRVNTNTNKLENSTAPSPKSGLKLK